MQEKLDFGPLRLFSHHMQAAHRIIHGQYPAMENQFGNHQCILRSKHYHAFLLYGGNAI